jgi:hypothetical protein
MISISGRRDLDAVELNLNHGRRMAAAGGSRRRFWREKREARARFGRDG